MKSSWKQWKRESASVQEGEWAIGGFKVLQRLLGHCTGFARVVGGGGGRFVCNPVSAISVYLLDTPKLIEIVLDHLIGKTSFRPSLFFDQKPAQSENHRFSVSEKFS